MKLLLIVAAANNWQSNTIIHRTFIAYTEGEITEIANVKRCSYLASIANC